MDITVFPGQLSGNLQAIPSKSQAHRVLICAAFADKPTFVHCKQTNDDIEATADCLNSLGAKIKRTDTGYFIEPVRTIPDQATLNCRESGSTLRFMLPIVGALGIDTVFNLSGRLPKRPLSPLWEEMERMGCSLSRPSENQIQCSGRLRAGSYIIDGGISSQFITGLLFAAALICGHSTIEITGKLESEPYIQLTRQVLHTFGVNTENYVIDGTYPFKSPETIAIEGDWSNAAFFLAANILGSKVDVTNLNPYSAQGDRACAKILEELHRGNSTVECKNIPDLVPVLAVAAAANHGATFKNIARLRLKESDRVESVMSMLHELGVSATAGADEMTVLPSAFSGGIINSVNDHRIAMAAAIAATKAAEPVTILGADCVKKSYPSFWDEFHRLGGHYEQYIR